VLESFEERERDESCSILQQKGGKMEKEKAADRKLSSSYYRAIKQYQQL
jgi:hypothetical protein